MRACANSPWRDFWANLKEGYDFFETYTREPTVTVRNGRYVFD
jgi:murein L,D-transpeptidase YafK